MKLGNEFFVFFSSAEGKRERERAPAEPNDNQKNTESIEISKNSDGPSVRNQRKFCYEDPNFDALGPPAHDH